MFTATVLLVQALLQPCVKKKINTEPKRGAAEHKKLQYENYMILTFQ